MDEIESRFLVGITAGSQELNAGIIQSLRGNKIALSKLTGRYDFQENL
jgi:hypothetical protein